LIDETVKAKMLSVGTTAGWGNGTHEPKDWIVDVTIVEFAKLSGSDIDLTAMVPAGTVNVDTYSRPGV
jgi:hypothetical protein